METRQEVSRSQYAQAPPDMREPLRVDPKYPLSSSIPPSEALDHSPVPDSANHNGMSRRKSRRRRASGTGSSEKAQLESFPQPPAPEVPRAPPVSYRDPYANGHSSNSRNNNSTSFAARARALPGDTEFIPISPRRNNLEPDDPISPDQITRHKRHGSVNRNSVDYSQSHPPVSDKIEPATAGSAARQQLPGVGTYRPKQYTDQGSPLQAVERSSSGAYKDAKSVSSRSNTRRSPAGVPDPHSEFPADRSPLQSLEIKLNDISKEEKRARVEEAERQLRESLANSGRRRTSVEEDPAVKRTSSRHVSTDTGVRSDKEPSSQHKDAKRGAVSRDIAGESNNFIAEHRHVGGRNDTPPERLTEPQQRNVYRQSTPHYTPPGSHQPSTRHRTRQTSGRSADVWEPENQPGRGVRFEGNGQSENQDQSPITQSDHGAQRSHRSDQRGMEPPLDGATESKGAQRPQRVGYDEGKSVMSNQSSRQIPTEQQELYSQRTQPANDNDSATKYGGAPDPVPGYAIRGHKQASKYEIPPQTAPGIRSKQKVGFGSTQGDAVEPPARHKHHLSDILHHGHKDAVHQSRDIDAEPRRLDEWRHGGTARLTAADFDLPNTLKTSQSQKAWWEGGRSGSQRTPTGAKKDLANGVHSMNGNYQDDYAPKTDSFDPPLYLKCGPLLRYTGLKRDRQQGTSSRNATSTTEREFWRGSVMIVTSDAESTYNPTPTLRVYPEPMDLLPPPPQRVEEDSGYDLPAEYIDPIAGLPKLSRTGKTIYVKPVEDLEQEADLSRVEDDTGLYEETRTAAVPTSYGTPDFRAGRGNPSKTASSNDRHIDVRRSSKGQEVRGIRLHAERGCTFWRFNLEVELVAHQARIAYRINNSASVGFWVPAKGQTMNIMFHSCNGFSASVNPALFSGPDPLWRDVLNSHQTRPFHAMIGGGDQIYNDAVMTQTKLFQQWLNTKNPHHKHEAEFTSEMRDELETFYLERYSMWFSQGLFGMATSQIPMINIWDDHDIIDGYGSYPHHFMTTPVFCGLGEIAFKYYMLFQHQSVAGEGPADEPSWLTGAAPGPYINELSRSIFMFLGKRVAFLGIDARTERMRDEILSEASYELIFDRCRREIIEGETKHLIVLLGVPIAYPRLVWLETLLTSRLMDPVKALARTGMLGGFLNKFDGGVEILDDLDDHWTAKRHKQERNWFIQELQELAAEKSVRVTILGGDVHLAAIGQFYSNPKLKIPKDKDHRYMANIISSAIVNTPPPEVMGDILNRRNKTHHFDEETDENMIPMFTHDVDGKPRNNHHLLPRRNWCSIREYQPGSTPPPTPPQSEPETEDEEDPRPTGRLQRTLSLTRGDVKPGNLIRRLSGRGPPPSNDYPASNEYRPQSASAASPTTEAFFNLPRKSATNQSSPNTNGNGNGIGNGIGTVQRHSSAPIPRPGTFHRRPTNMSENAATRGDTDEDIAGHINLERGLDIVLNCEVNQKDPAGITAPYRLLVPALSYEGPGDPNRLDYRKKKNVLKRLATVRSKGGRRKDPGLAARQGQGNWGQSESEVGESEPGIDEAAIGQRRDWYHGGNGPVSERNLTQRHNADWTVDGARVSPTTRETPSTAHGTPRQHQHQRQDEDRGTEPPGQNFASQQSTPTQRRGAYTGDLQRYPSAATTPAQATGYSAHTSSPGQNSGYPGRNLSKAERMMGVGVDDHEQVPRFNGGARHGTPTGMRLQNQGRYEDDDDDDEGYGRDERFDVDRDGRGRGGKGYSGIEAYGSGGSKKGWRRFLSERFGGEREN